MTWQRRRNNMKFSQENDIRWKFPPIFDTFLFSRFPTRSNDQTGNELVCYVCITTRHECMNVGRIFPYQNKLGAYINSRVVCPWIAQISSKEKKLSNLFSRLFMGAISFFWRRRRYSRVEGEFAVVSHLQWLLLCSLNFVAFEIQI